MKVQYLSAVHFKSNFSSSRPPIKPLKEIIPTSEIEELISGSRPENDIEKLKSYGFRDIFDADNELRRRQGLPLYIRSNYSHYDNIYDDNICGSFYMPGEREHYEVTVPVARKYRSQIRRIEQNDTESARLLSKKIRHNKEAYKTFGISNKFKRVIELFDPEVIEIMDDRFLSYIIAPEESLKIQTKEIIQISKRIQAGKAKKDDIRKYNISHIAKDLLCENDRINKLKMLKDNFSAYEIDEILHGENSSSKRFCLLKWLLNFDTYDNNRALFEYLKS